jgi:AraC-like DNA-binding protein
MISFHAILSGSCWAALAGSSDSSARFNAGDIVIYPRGDANVLSSRNERRSRLRAILSAEGPAPADRDPPQRWRRRLLSLGLKHRHVGHALRLIHGQPAKPWTLAMLAREVGLSRSVFADRFARYVGVSPMHYLGRWRMQLAIRRLTIPGVSVAQAGAEVGYESEAAFSRAFKKYVGVPPGSWRRGRSSMAAPK